MRPQQLLAGSLLLFPHGAVGNTQPKKALQKLETYLPTCPGRRIPTYNDGTYDIENNKPIEARDLTTLDITYFGYIIHHTSTRRASERLSLGAERSPVVVLGGLTRKIPE